MKILVTGGAGFIGSHLCSQLIEANHEVVVWDILHTGRKENISHLLDHSSFQFHEFDVREPHLIEVEAIINLACPASPPHYQKDPIFTWETSILGVRNLLNLAKNNRAIFLHASTSEVYGDPLQHPQTEEYWGNVNPIGIRSCYDEGKRAAETLIFDFIRFHDLDARVFRIFNTYGPNMHPNDGRVVSNFCMQALRKETITIYGDGNQTRSFCYVSDLVNGIIAMLFNSKPLPFPINLGNPGEFTMIELAKLIFEQLEYQGEFSYLPLPQDDPIKRKPNISRAKQELNWEPKVSLKEGIASTLEYFKTQL